MLHLLVFLACCVSSTYSLPCFCSNEQQYKMYITCTMRAHCRAIKCFWLIARVVVVGE